MYKKVFTTISTAPYPSDCKEQRGGPTRFQFTGCVGWTRAAAAGYDRPSGPAAAAASGCRGTGSTEPGHGRTGSGYDRPGQTAAGGAAGCLTAALEQTCGTGWTEPRRGTGRTDPGSSGYAG